MKNGYLKRRDVRDQTILDIGLEMGFQKCWDLVNLALRDQAVTGKGHAWGRGRMERLYKAVQQLEHDFREAWTIGQEADYLQENMDRCLQEIWGDDLTPFRKRYEYVKQYNYNKKMRNL